MNIVQEFFVVMLTAIVLQNAVFTRGLGANKRTFSLSSPRKILFFGAMLSFVTVLSSVLAWPLNNLLREKESLGVGRIYLRYLLVIFCICVVFALMFLITRAFLPKLHYHLRMMMFSASFNSAALGSILIAFSESYGFVKTLGFALGSGIGCTLAFLLVYEGKRRLSLADVPKSFRGLPIMLLYIGIFSLAIYGLIGHQLPT